MTLLTPITGEDPCPHKVKAFTLTELLVVMGIIILVTAIAVPAFKHLGRTSLLRSEGGKMVGLISRASQNSVSRNAMTALVAVPAESADGKDFRAFTLFQYVAGDSAWQQITNWEVLKDGIIVDPGGLVFTDYPGVKPAPDLPVVNFQGQDRPSFKYIIFLPDRSLLHDNQAAEISLAEGFFATAASTPTFTRPGDNGPANFYKINILPATGRVIVERP